MPRRRKIFSKTITELGVAVRLYERERGGPLYREVRLDGRKDRKSLGHSDPVLAEQQARALARRLAEHQLAGVAGPLTLGALLRLYLTHRGPLLSPARRKGVAMHTGLLLAHFGDGYVVQHMNQTDVDAFVAARRSGALKSARPITEGAKVRDGTIRHHLAWLATVLRWARGHKVNGRRLLDVNPMEGIELPQERNVRRPIASVERYDRTMTKAAESDPLGRLGCMLALARYTGRRLNAICNLRTSDVLLTREQLLAALAARGDDERRADHMPHGALVWRPEHDKLGFAELAPLSAAARRAIDAYLRAHPRAGDVPLFPSTRDASQPIHKQTATYLLAAAERRAKVPKLERGLWHPYRRLWASERKHLPDVDVMRAGGWRDLATMKSAYQQADAATMLRVVENAPETAAPPNAEEPGAGGGNIDSPREARGSGHTKDTPRKRSGGGTTR